MRRTNLMLLIVSAFLIISSLFNCYSAAQERKMQREIKDLRAYIAAGCHGRYQGEGEQP